MSGSMYQGSVEEIAETYDLDAVLAWLLGNGLSAEDIRLAMCPHCGELTPYAGLEDSHCSACQERIGEVGETVSVAEYWESQLEGGVLWGGAEA